MLSIHASSSLLGSRHVFARWSRRGLQRAAISTESSADILPFDILPYRAASARLEHIDHLALLPQTIDAWRTQKLSSAWITVPVTSASLCEAANMQFGFELHHTTKYGEIVMKRWLKDGSEDKVPPFATHQVGCAGFVLSENNELLVIKEWAPDRTPSPQWKLPGGMTDAGESFGEGAIREVYEETGITCKFESILSFWNRHNLTWGKSDLYVVCFLRPTTGLRIAIDPEEVSQCRWMPLDEFVQQEDHPLILKICEMAFNLRKDEKTPSNNTMAHQRESPTSVLGDQPRLIPRYSIGEVDVQWPGRPPIPTYMCR